MQKLSRVVLCLAIVVCLLNSSVLSYTCSDTTVIDDENVCDFREDCPDGGDEATCPATCDFETGMCMWTHENNFQLATFKWSMWSNNGPPGCPAADHTLNSVNGHYIYVDDGFTTVGSNAIIRSPTYTQAARGCTFSFWYFVYGADFGALKVWQYTPANDRSFVLMTAVDAGDDLAIVDRWNLYQVEVQACATNFQLSIEGVDTNSNQNTGGYAIDDIRFQGCAYVLPVPPGGTCGEGQGMCDSGHCYPTSEKCDFTPNCCDGTDESHPNCATYKMCDFQSGMCDWQQMTNGQFDWTRQKGSTSQTGPTKDHTTHSDDGFYLYMNGGAAFPGDFSRIGSYYIQATSSGCEMRFYYHMQGTGIGTLNVYTMTEINGPMPTLWTTSDAVGDSWVYHKEVLTSPVAFQVILEGVRGTSNVGDLSLDDISFTPACVESMESLPNPEGTPPPTVNCPAGQRPCNINFCVDQVRYCDFKQDCLPAQEDERYCPATCDFENGMCFWSQDVADDFDWSVYDAQSRPTGFLGPVIDHTSSTAQGTYLFVDGTSSTLNTFARLISPIYANAPRGCVFNMWFYMFSLEYGNLVVRLRTLDGWDTRLTKVRDNALDYNAWLMWSTDIPPCTTNFQIVIEVEDEQRNPVESGFALDDLEFMNCVFPNPEDTCAGNQMQCMTGECYPTEQHCDMSPDCCDMTDEDRNNCRAMGYSMCDFEDGMCEWEQLSSDEFDWTWQRGKTASTWRRTGPHTDHTTMTDAGYYIFTESSDVPERRRYGDRARVASFPIRATTTGDCSIRFFYHMEGQGIGTFNIYTRTTINGPMARIWYREDQMGGQWIYENMVLRSGYDFQLIFEGVIGYTMESDIALDDISFTPGCIHAPPLAELTTPQYTGSTAGARTIIGNCVGNRFFCSVDNACIDDELVCDGNNDCSNGEDESKCQPPDDNTALIIGLSVTFGLLFLVACGAGGYCFVRRRKEKASNSIRLS